MARWHSPLVAVVERDQLLGAVTVSRLLGLLLPGSARLAEGTSRSAAPGTGASSTDAGRSDSGESADPPEPGPTK
jgi:hypothetical protein